MSQSLRSMTAEQCTAAVVRRTRAGAARGLGYLAARALHGQPAKAKPGQEKFVQGHFFKIQGTVSAWIDREADNEIGNTPWAKAA